MRRSFAAGLLLACLGLLQVTAFDDASRLGKYVTGIPIYRTVGNTNAVQAVLNGQNLNLTLSTSVDYIMVVGSDCANCANDIDLYDPSKSSWWKSSGTALDYKIENPYAHPGPRTAQQADDVDSPESPTLIDVDGVIGTEQITDTRQDKELRSIVVVQNMAAADGGNSRARMERGSAGFWGLGIDTSSPMNSIISSVRSSQSATNFTVGFAMNPWSSDMTSAAGELHCGAALGTAYDGPFNWIETLGKAPFWSIALDRISVNGYDLAGKGLPTVLEPGYNVIAAPYAIAQQLYARVKGAVQHPLNTNRRIVPCENEFTLSVRIHSHTYDIPNESLIQMQTAKECWGAIVAWSEGTAPDQSGRIVLGTPFLAYFYAVLFYGEQESFVGIAGRPGLATKPSRYGSQKLSGSATGGIVAAVTIVLIIGLIACYARQSSSPAGWYHRNMRRQHRVAVNQMKMINPMAPTPPMILGAPPIMATPRTEIYSKPYIKGFSARERSQGMMLDPNLMAFQQQQAQLLNDQQEVPQAGHGHEAHHQLHGSAYYHHVNHADHATGEGKGGFIGAIRRLFQREPTAQHDVFEPPHRRRRRHSSHERHQSGNVSIDPHSTPGPSRPHSSHSRRHRHRRHHASSSYDGRGSREGTYTGYDTPNSAFLAHSGGHAGQNPYHGPYPDQWGQRPMLPGDEQLFYDPQNHHPHMGGPMIHNGPHEAYEQQHLPPPYAIPQQDQGGYFRRMFG